MWECECLQCGYFEVRHFELDACPSCGAPMQCFCKDIPYNENETGEEEE
jgi:hypothetical protein